LFIACQAVPMNRPVSCSTPTGLIMNEAQVFATIMITVPQTFSRMPSTMCQPL